MRMRLLLPAVLLVLVVVPVGALEADASRPVLDGFHPTLGAQGDLVYVQGTGLGPSPEVTFDGRAAEVLRSGAEVLLCRVPKGLREGSVEVSVGGEVLSERFRVVAPTMPLILGSSSEVATPGQALLLHGRRLGQGRVDFVYVHGAVAASTMTVGGRRVAVARVPRDLLPGLYDVRYTNRHGDASPRGAWRIEVCRPGPRRVHTVCGGTVHPGQRVTYVGSNLGPLGTCEVRWVGGDGTGWCARGWSNGYDRIAAVVPFDLLVDHWHPLLLGPPGESATSVCRVLGEAAEAPEALHLDVHTAPPGATVGLQGMPPRGLGAMPEVRLSREGETVDARTLYFHPGGLGHGRAWVVRLPENLERGDHAVSVRVGDVWHDAGRLRVGEARGTTTVASR